MPVLLLLPLAMSMVEPPATLAILPTQTTPAMKMDGKLEGGLRGLSGDAKPLPSSFVDAQADPDPTADNSIPEVEMLNALSEQLDQCEKDVDALQAANERNGQAIEDMHEAAKEDMQLEEANRQQINKLTQMYSLLTSTALAEEQVQSTESAQQTNAGSEAAELAGKAAEENRVLDGSEGTSDTQRTQLNVITASLNSKVQTSQSHMATLETWSLTVASNTNVATGELGELRSQLLTLDDAMQQLQDQVLKLFSDVHISKGGVMLEEAVAAATA